MKVFISWSGARSRDFAQAFHEWLPSVVQAVTPLLSVRDIQPGEQWNERLKVLLGEANFAVVCCTRENQDSKWLNFEAGVLSGVLGHENVVPVLLDFSVEQLEGPLAQFQSISAKKEDVGRLVARLFDRAKSPLSLKLQEQAFRLLWPILESQLKEVIKHEGKADGATVSKTETIERILSETDTDTGNAPKSPTETTPSKVEERLSPLLDKHAAVLTALSRLNSAQRQLSKKGTPLSIIDNAIMPKEQELQRLEAAIKAIDPKWVSKYTPEWTDVYSVDRGYQNS